MREAGQGASDGVEPVVPRGECNGLGRDQVSNIQRARMLAAMVDVAAEHGAAKATVAHVVARSGVSRRTFYEFFEDREDCFLAAFDDAIQRIATVVLPAYGQPSRWREQIRAGLTALLELLDHERATAQFVIVESLGAGPGALQRRQGVLARLFAAVDRGRTEVRREKYPPPLTAEGVVGAVFSILHTRILDEHSPPLVELAGALTSVIVLPYLGPAPAREQLERPTPKNTGMANNRNANPLKDLEMRLTYRTVRVLVAVGAYPGVSNRRIADTAGVADQGQISKLLARLEHVGLIENSGFGQAKGESNSWHLTNRGHEIEHAIHEHTEHN